MTASFDDIGIDDLIIPESRKWSLHPESIGAWVAEMDFGTAPEVTTALHEVVERGHLGYLSPATTERMARATAEWSRVEYGWDPGWEHVHPVSDVMSAYAVAVTRYSAPGSAVIVPTPAYMPFLSFTPTLDREVIQVPGRTDARGRWVHDIDAIDAAFARGAGTLVVCNPHNPTGRTLERAELEALAEVVERHGGRVFADEIHAPLRFGDAPHIPYASISPATAAHTVTGTSASKAWNLPGLKAAQIILSSPDDEAQYGGFGFSVLHGASTPGVVASAVAYESGRAWLDEVIDYLRGSRDRLIELVEEELPGVRVVAPEATYIAWLDCRALDLGASPAQFFLEQARVALTDGALCGQGFEGFARFVFAMPRPVLETAVRRMGSALRGR